MTVETPTTTEMGMDGTYPVEILDSFYVAPGHCFRMFRSGDRRAAHCAEPVVWRGPWRDVTGEEWTVEACERHLPDHAGRDPFSSDR
jgi:hypothetical protein